MKRHKKLSATQQRALNKLNEKFRSAYTMGESLSTMESLVNAGLAEKHIDTLGSIAFPRVHTFFRLSKLHYAANT